MPKHAAAAASAEVAPLPRVLIPHPHIRCDIRTLGGSPHVAGTKVPVRRLWSWHRSGVSIDSLMKRYPSLGPAKVLDALAFAYDNRSVVEADLEREYAAVQAAAVTKQERATRQQSFFFATDLRKG